MKKIVLSVAGVVGVGLLGLCGFIAMQPASFSVERTATIAARPDVAFALVQDFHQWSRWSPWEKMDPTMAKTFDGAEAGVGAIYSWKGNDEVGTGKMTIESVTGPTNVAIKLEFLEPFAATNSTVFAFAPEGQGTRVTWSMTGENDFMGKAMSLVMNMDTMVGGDFERGLANLGTAATEDEAKKVAEEAAAALKAAEEAAAAAALLADPNAVPVVAPAAH